MSLPVIAETPSLYELKQGLVARARVLGFQQTGIAGIDVSHCHDHLLHWLAEKNHGSMLWMARNSEKRLAPDRLVPGVVRVISCRINYQPVNDPKAENSPQLGMISRYAAGRDYHRIVRRRLATLGKWLRSQTETRICRAFVDSAPVLERAMATQAGLGWIGKNTMLINRKAGSWFFIGELFTDLPLPVDEPHTKQYCGNCSACIAACPTNAFIAPWRLDARRCISYLTIENRGSIPIELRNKIGNRIFGCDECQRVCPWNRNAPHSGEIDFTPRTDLDSRDLCELFAWSEQQFQNRTRSSPVRRCGYPGWLRNIAVALGNAPTSREIVAALQNRCNHSSALVREHVQWALAQHGVQ